MRQIAYQCCTLSLFSRTLIHNYLRLFIFIDYFYSQIIIFVLPDIRVSLVPVIYQGVAILKRDGLKKKVYSILFDETSKLYELLKSALDVEQIEVTDISFYQKEYFIIEIKCKPVHRQKLVLFLNSFCFKEVLLSFGKTLAKILRWNKTHQIQFKVLAIDERFVY